MGLFDWFRKNKQKKEESKKYKEGLEKTRKQGSLSRLTRLFNEKDKVDDDLFDQLEEIFVMADMGVETTVKFIDSLRDDERLDDLEDMKLLQEIIVDKMFDLYLKGEIVNSNLNVNKEGLSVYLFVG